MSGGLLIEKRTFGVFVAALVLITVVWGHGRGANPLELDDISAYASD